MQTIREIKKDNFAIFKTIEDSYSRLNQMNAVLYIEQLSALTSTPIDSWPILDLFKTSDSPLLVTNKNDINKRFFEFKSTQTVISPKITPEQVELIKGIEHLGVESTKQKLMYDRERALRNAASHMQTHFDHISSARRCSAELQAINGQSTPLVADLTRIVEQGRWSLEAINSSGDIFLNLNNEVVLSYKNQSAGISCEVNLGLFGAVYNVASASLSVFGRGKNLAIHSIKHPHINSDRLCFGELQNAATDALVKRNIVKLFDLVFDVLNSYNHASPYVLLQDFDALAKHEDSPFLTPDRNRRIDRDSMYFRGEISPVSASKKAAIAASLEDYEPDEDEEPSDEERNEDEEPNF